MRNEESRLNEQQEAWKDAVETFDKLMEHAYYGPMFRQVLASNPEALATAKRLVSILENKGPLPSAPKDNANATDGVYRSASIKDHEGHGLSIEISDPSTRPKTEPQDPEWW